jgi:hypothetical protein
MPEGAAASSATRTHRVPISNPNPCEFTCMHPCSGRTRSHCDLSRGTNKENAHIIFLFPFIHFSTRPEPQSSNPIADKTRRAQPSPTSPATRPPRDSRRINHVITTTASANFVANRYLHLPSPSTNAVIGATARPRNHDHIIQHEQRRNRSVGSSH